MRGAESGASGYARLAAEVYYLLREGKTRGERECDKTAAGDDLDSLALKSCLDF